MAWDGPIAVHADEKSATGYEPFNISVHSVIIIKIIWNCIHQTDRSVNIYKHKGKYSEQTSVEPN